MAQTNQRRRAFDYRPPSYEEAKALSERKGGRYDGMFLEGIKFFKAKEGDNEIRPFPPTWDNAAHYSYEVKIHRDIGADKQTYLCLNQEGSPEPGQCPVCAERAELARRKNVDQKELDALRAQTSEVIFLVDRNKREEGPMVWMISPRTDNEILAQSLIKKTQTYLPVAHPIDGYDIEFSRVGTGRGTKYNGFKVARDSTPLTDDPDQMDEWLSYVETHPIPDILRFYPAERIRAVFHGEAAVGGEGDPDEHGGDSSAESIRSRARPGNGAAEPERAAEPEPIAGNGSAEQPAEPQTTSRRARLDEPTAPAQPAAVAETTSLKDRLRQRLAARE